ncbi:polysaccharide biosynthesis/export family protein [Labrenzia sp. PHM005]|uniref:polysaccharide biosynthesis/export family protein n=1 Tax=Labrenzia sp. PHM005 TaxID=2590016 RepID=UPI00143D074E|nr:polysaccharide biosynthesis/export family protein [Labrenzia sp. PHM005]
MRFIPNTNTRRFSTETVGIFLLLVFALPVLSLGGSNPTAANEYSLGIQDRLRIYVAEWPALTDEFEVGASGSVVLPIVGEVNAAGLAPRELAMEIAERLQEQAKLRTLPNVAVDISAYRPFYILGAVTSPGEYAYRPGMLVLNALSIAGGVYRPPSQSEWGLESSAINTLGELRTLRSQAADLEAEKIRYQAQAKGETQFPSFPENAAPNLARALAEQALLFRASLQRFNNEKKSLTTAITLFEGQITLLNQQLEDAKLKLDSFQTELEKIQNLIKEGYGSPRLLPLNREIADGQLEKKRLEIGLLRAKQELETARIELRDHEANYLGDAETQLVRIRSELRANLERVKTQESLVNSASGFTDRQQLDNQISLPQSLKFTIIRTVSGEVQTLNAEETTSVDPGDIVKVARFGDDDLSGAIPQRVSSGSLRLGE